MLLKFAKWAQIRQKSLNLSSFKMSYYLLSQISLLLPHKVHNDWQLVMQTSVLTLYVKMSIFGILMTMQKSLCLFSAAMVISHRHKKRLYLQHDLWLITNPSISKFWVFTRVLRKQNISQIPTFNIFILLLNLYFLYFLLVKSSSNKSYCCNLFKYLYYAVQC